MAYGPLLAAILAAGFQIGVQVKTQRDGSIELRPPRPGWTALSETTVVLDHQAAKCHRRCTSVAVDRATGLGALVTRRACLFHVTVDDAGCVALRGCSLDASACP